MYPSPSSVTLCHTSKLLKIRDAGTLLLYPAKIKYPDAKGCPSTSIRYSGPGVSCDDKGAVAVPGDMGLHACSNVPSFDGQCSSDVGPNGTVVVRVADVSEIRVGVCHYPTSGRPAVSSGPVIPAVVTKRHSTGPSGVIRGSVSIVASTVEA
jgi:hypothetical protein